MLGIPVKRSVIWKCMGSRLLGVRSASPQESSNAFWRSARYDWLWKQSPEETSVGFYFHIASVQRPGLDSSHSTSTNYTGSIRKTNITVTSLSRLRKQLLRAFPEYDLPFCSLARIFFSKMKTIFDRECMGMKIFIWPQNVSSQNSNNI